jgi:hypothetical protein
MNKAIFEVLEAVAAVQTREEKREILKSNDDLVLRDILRGAFDDSITWKLPVGPIPIEVVEPKGDKLGLYSAAAELKYFVVGGPGHRLPAVQREKRFFDMLAKCHPKDADLIVAMKDKKLTGKYKGLTKKLVQDTWPNLILR